MDSKPLNSLYIHQFRGIRDLELKDLGQFNVLVGVNNSGKTSVLEALYLYLAPLIQMQWFSLIQLRDDQLSALDSLLWLFPQDKSTSTHHNISISSHGVYAVKSIKSNYSIFDKIKDFQQKKLEKSIEIKINILAKEDDNNEHQEVSHSFSFADSHGGQIITDSEELKKYRFLCTYITPTSHRIDSYPSKLLTEAIKLGLKSNLITLLNIFDQQIKDLVILDSPNISSLLVPEIYIEHDKLGLIPISAFGDGVRRLVFIALQLVQLKNGILLIDELENTIHTKALKDAFQWIVKWCQELNIQLFATTHSLEAVDTMLSVTNSDLVLYRLDPKDNDMSALRIGRDRLQRLRENLGMEVRW
ncbi:MAG: ATP/GTP-binding protein [Microcystaceae cyanobacterium]